jgi:hypothetical protein
MTLYQGGKRRFIAAFQIAAQQLAVGQRGGGITGQVADVLQETLAIGGVHSSVLAVKGYYRIRVKSRTERNNFLARRTEPEA